MDTLPIAVSVGARTDIIIPLFDVLWWSTTLVYGHHSVCNYLRTTDRALSIHYPNLLEERLKPFVKDESKT